MIEPYRTIAHVALKCVHYGVNLLFPKDSKKILFQSGPEDYVDNSRALSDYILSKQEYADYKVYWAMKSDSVPFTDSRIYCFNRTGKYGVIKYFYHTVTAKYMFSTHGAFGWFCHYRQKYLCLWHGSMLKKIGFLQDPVANKYYQRHCKMISTSSEYYRDIYARNFGKNKNEIYATGYPRTDLLFKDTDCLSKLGVDVCQYCKIIFYMPTFRHTEDSTTNVFEKGYIRFTDDNNLDTWNEYLKGKKMLLIVKPHPSDKNTPSHINLSNIKVITNNDLFKVNIQLYELIHYADALLTDFSGVYTDYMILDRPIGFLLDDFEEYGKGRGFVFDNPIDYMPGAIITDSNQFETFLSEIALNIDSTAEKRKKLKHVYNDFFDGKSCERCLKAVGL